MFGKTTEKISGREITEKEFLDIIKKEYLKTTYATEVLFEDCIPKLKKVFEKKLQISGRVTLADAQICAGTYTVLDQGL